MFNWFSAPTFIGMLLLWVMACYVLTRSPRSLVAYTAVAAQVAGAAYLMGQGMLANASTVEEWRSWADRMQWGAPLAPLLWYWVTALLLRDQKAGRADRYLRWAGYPLGAALTAGGLVFTAGIYVDGWLYDWGSPESVPAALASYFRYRAPEGPLYPAFVAFMVASMLGAAANTWVGWRLPIDEQRRRRFAWLLLSAVLLLLGTTPAGVANWLGWPYWPTWLGHLVLAAAIALVATNVAAYSMLFRGQALRTDLIYFLVATGAVCLLYALAFALTGVGYSFRLLELLVVVLILAVLTHALVGPARLVLDRLFFGSDVRRLRSDLSAVVQDAALTTDLGTLLSQARTNLAEISEEHMVRLTEEALRRLNNPSALARCGLIAEIPSTLSAGGCENGPVVGEPTPLEQARCLREVVAAAVERLKPSAQDERTSAPAALQYHILRDEYLLGMPNKQIMMRRSISEGTFHRNRREAIAVLARDLRTQEEQLARRAT